MRRFDARLATNQLRKHIGYAIAITGALLLTACVQNTAPTTVTNTAQPQGIAERSGEGASISPGETELRLQLSVVYAAE